MKCTSRKKVLSTIALFMTCCIFTGCGKQEISIPYDMNSGVTAFRFDANDNAKVAESFASDLCVVSEDITVGDELSGGTDMYGSATLFDINRKNAIYSKNANIKLYPASMTKVMTAYLALKYGNPEDILTASDNVLITEQGAQLCGFQPGDTMTLDQALHGLLMYSGNDAAVIIAEYISGSIDDFATLMNSEAAKLGATNTHFVNPHGLQDENHYTTAYDMYLIFNEAIKNDLFNEIIHMTTYSTTYKNSAGEPKEVSYDTTNRFIKDEVTSPTNINVIGGKTGTTSAAGANLVLLSKDSAGNPYISVVMKAVDMDTCYQKTNLLLEDIDK